MTILLGKPKRRARFCRHPAHRSMFHLWLGTLMANLREAMEVVS